MEEYRLFAAICAYGRHELGLSGVIMGYRSGIVTCVGYMYFGGTADNDEELWPSPA